MRTVVPDRVAAAVGLQLEDLGGVRAVAGAEPVGPVVDHAILDLFHGSDPVRSWRLARPEDRAVLTEQGWTTPDGIASDRARAVRGDLRTDSVTYALRAQTTEGEHAASIIAGARHALLLWQAEPRPWGAPAAPVAGQVRFAVVACGMVPLLCARWAGLGPAWSLDTGDLEVEAGVFDARMRDSLIPAPSGADGPLAAMWANPWRRWTLRCDSRGLRVSYLDAADRGQYSVQYPDPDTVRLRARPGALVWGELLRFCFPPAQQHDDWHVLGDASW